MAQNIPTGGRPQPGKDNLPLATILELGQRYDRTPCLVLQVKLGGQDQSFSLTLDELAKFGMTGPAGVDELRRIRQLLEQFVAFAVPDPGNALPLKKGLSSHE